MQELNTQEIEVVAGGFFWLLVPIAIAGLAGCGEKSPAVNREQKNVNKIDQAVKDAGG